MISSIDFSIKQYNITYVLHYVKNFNISKARNNKQLQRSVLNA